MKKINPALFSSLRSASICLAYCWRIETRDGEVVGFTEHDKELTINGEVYTPTNSFSSSAFTAKNDGSVANASVTALASNALDEKRLHAGEFDEADVKVFLVDWSAPEKGTIPVLAARFGEVKFMDGKFETEIRSRGQALQQKLGRTYGLECDTDLGSMECGINLADWTYTGSVTGLNTSSSFFDDARTEEDDFFAYGKLTFTSGENTGLTLEVLGYKLDKKVLVLLEAPFYPIQLGDQYSITAGCDHTCTTCTTKFSNIENFQGFPHMPTEQTLRAIPDDRSQN